MNDIENYRQENHGGFDAVVTDGNSVPPKPIAAETKNSLRKSLISMLLFVIVFYLVFKFDLLMIFILAGIILIHEMGHYLAMKVFNYKDLSVFFVPLIGAYASGTKDQVSQKQKVIILLAGPVPGIIIGILLFYLGMYYNIGLLLKTANIFIFLNLFNLVPVYPLDGGQLLKTMFFSRNNIFQMFFMILSILLLAAWAIYRETFSFLLIPALLVGQLVGMVRLQRTRNELKERGFNLDKTYDELSDADYWDIREAVLSNNKLFAEDAISGKYEISPREGQILTQVKNVIYKEPVQDLKILGKIVTTVTWILCFVLPVVLILFRLFQSWMED